MSQQTNHPTLENLAAQLEKRGFVPEICKGFIAVKYGKITKESSPPQKPGFVPHGLELWFCKKLVITNKTAQGFNIAFEG